MKTYIILILGLALLPHQGHTSDAPEAPSNGCARTLNRIAQVSPITDHSRFEELKSLLNAYENNKGALAWIEGREMGRVSRAALGNSIAIDEIKKEIAGAREAANDAANVFKNVPDLREFYLVTAKHYQSHLDFLEERLKEIANGISQK